MNRTTEIGWLDPETEEDFRVVLSYTPGEAPSRDYPGSGPEFVVESVREDRPGGAYRPDLIAIVEAELSGDDAADAIAEDEDDRYIDAMERRGSADREERRQ